MLFENKTKNEGKYYLYQYVRLDKNEVFYIGISTRYKGSNDHSRAKWGRHNHICRKITGKTEYRIEIIDEHNDYDYIKQREINLIAQYGRISNGTGCLANLTDGGDGTTNSILRKKCYSYTLAGIFHMEFDSLTAAANYFHTTIGSLYPVMKYPKKGYLCAGYQFRDYKTDYIPATVDKHERTSRQFAKPIIQLTRDGKFVKEWKSAVEAAKTLGFIGSRRHICDCCLGARKTAKGFRWQFKENNS